MRPHSFWSNWRSQRIPSAVAIVCSATRQWRYDKLNQSSTPQDKLKPSISLFDKGPFWLIRNQPDPECFLTSPEIEIADLIQWRWSIGSWMRIRPATCSLATACGQWHNPFLGYSLTPLCQIMMTFKSSHLLGARACLRLDSWLHSEWLDAMQTCNSSFVSEERLPWNVVSESEQFTHAVDSF